jgi:hypothetical protein
VQQKCAPQIGEAVKVEFDRFWEKTSEQAPVVSRYFGKSMLILTRSGLISAIELGVRAAT